MLSFASLKTASSLFRLPKPIASGVPKCKLQPRQCIRPSLAAKYLKQHQNPVAGFSSLSSLVKVYGTNKNPFLQLKTRSYTYSGYSRSEEDIRREKIRDEVANRILEWENSLPAVDPQSNYIPLSPSEIDENINIVRDILSPLYHQTQGDKIWSVFVLLNKQLQLTDSQRFEVHRMGIEVYSRIQLLNKAEQMLFELRKKYKLKPTLEMYEQILALSGRHKSVTSIEHTYESWKEDFLLKKLPTKDEKTPNNRQNDEFEEVPIDLIGTNKYTGPIDINEYIHPDNQEVVIKLFAATIRAFSRAKHIEGSISTFDDACRLFNQNKTQLLYLHEIMVEAYCFVNRVEDAHILTISMNIAGIQPSYLLLHTLLSSCSRLGNHFLLEKIFAEMEDLFGRKPNITSWNFVFECYCKKNDMLTAHARFMDLLAEKRKMLAQSNGANVPDLVLPNLETYEILIPGHVRAKDSLRSFEMYKHAHSNHIEMPAQLYAWVMEGFLTDKETNFDQAFKILDEMKEKQLLLPKKFQNLLLSKCRKAELIDKYESYFGEAPEIVDDLKEIKIHVQLKKKIDKGEAGVSSKASKPTGKQARVKSSKEELIGTAENQSNPELQSELEAQPPQAVSKDDIGILEEIVEDESEISLEEWMKDDLGEHGWKSFDDFESVSASKPKGKLAHLKNLRYKEVFELAGWDTPNDVEGPYKKKEWQLLDDDFSRTRPEKIALRKELQRSADQIQTLEREAIIQLDAMTQKAKIKEQRRRERAYGSTRKYAPKPAEPKKRVRTDRPPPGSTFSFR